MVSPVKERTAMAVNMMVGISMTTAEPILVLKKVMVASQPLEEGRRRRNKWRTVLRQGSLMVTIQLNSRPMADNQVNQ